MYGQAFGLTGVSPKTSACFASTWGVVTYFIHLYAQFGCGALLAIIHVSAQPVVAFGIDLLDGRLGRLQLQRLVRPAGADDTSPFLKT